MSKCSVPGCRENQPPLHVFPKYPHLFEEWKRRTQLPKTLSDDTILKNRKVCDAHFTSFNRNSEVPHPRCARLRYCSVPSINVPGFSGEPTKENSFFYLPNYLNTPALPKNCKVCNAEPRLSDPIWSLLPIEEDRPENDTSIQNDAVVVESPIQNDAVVESPIQNYAVVESPIQNIAVVESPIQNDAVVESPIQNILVVESAIQNDAVVVESPIQNDSVVESPIQNDAVVESPIQNIAVGESPIQSDNVVESSIQKYTFPKSNTYFKAAAETNNALLLLFNVHSEECFKLKSRITVEEPVIMEEYEESVIMEEFEEPALREEFEEPVITEEFEDPVITEEFEEPVMTEEFEGPVITQDFEEPALTEEFEDPVMTEEFEEPVIIQEFEEPALTEGFEEPALTEGFEEPVITEEFEEPVITLEFEEPALTEGFEEPVMTEEFEEPMITQEFEEPMITEEIPYTVFRDDSFLIKKKNRTFFSIICRICATSNAYLIPLYGHESNECDLRTKISCYLPIQATIGDLICFPCAVAVISFHQLVVNFKEASAVFSQKSDHHQVQMYHIAVDKFFKENQFHQEFKHSLVEPESDVCSLGWNEILMSELQYLTCHLCFESFPELDRLKDHLVDCEKVVCPNCRSIFQNADDMNEHKNSCHLFQCYMCMKTSRDSRALLRHLKSSHSTIKCPLCTKKFMSDVECEIHKTKNHNFLCECCNKPFQSSLSVMKYRLSIMPYGSLLCLSCFGVSQFNPKTDKIAKARTKMFFDSNPISIKKEIVNDTEMGNFEIKILTDGLPTLESNGTITNNSRATFVGENRMDHLNDHIYTEDNTYTKNNSYTEDNNPVICTHCSKRFSSLNFLKFHILKVHPTEPAYHCKNCYISFQSEDHLRIHSKWNCPLTCSVCGTVVEGIRRLKAHKTKYHEKNTLPCNQCNKVFKTKSVLRVHIKGVHQGIKGKKILCVECGELIYSREYKKHYARYHSTEPVRCNYCLKTVTSNLLKQHITETHIKGQFKCAMCSRVFVQKRFLVRHFNIMHSSSAALCIICNSPFTNARCLDKHIARIHTSGYVKVDDLDEYKCLHCEVVFDYTSMIDHEKMLCEKYGKYRKIRKRKSYKRKQYKRKPMPDAYCNICLKKFATRHTFLNHMSIVHSDVCKFQCSFCPRTFKRRDYKKNHERTHTDERPFSCSICFKKFRYRSDCNRHVVKYHNSLLDRKQLVIVEKQEYHSAELDESDTMQVQHEVEIDQQLQWNLL